MRKIFNSPPLEFDPIFKKYCLFAKQLKPFITDTSIFLDQAYKKKLGIIFECSQGTLLDIDFGTYPYVTSSNSIAAGVCTGSGFGPHRIDYVLGAMKAYITRVGKGPFPSEMNSDIAHKIREKGHEYGTVTKRPRRCGWLDIVVARYAIRVNGINSIALIKLDVLDDQDSIKICKAYQYKQSILTEFQSQLKTLSQCKPIYEELNGWKRNTSTLRKLDEFPVEAKKYMERITELLDTPISIISIGPDREQTIPLETSYLVSPSEEE